MNSIHAHIKTASTLLSNSSESPLLDAEVLLCFVLQKQRSYLRAWPEQNLSVQQSTHFKTLIQQRALGKPVAYITGSREFWSKEFITTPDVLIPRPDTELLIELTLDLINQHKARKLLDLGTGSGAIAIILAIEHPEVDILACDNSLAALNIALQNAQAHHINNIQFQLSNWFENITQQQFDIIVSNPPYIAASDPHLQQGDVRFEPQHALVADNQGLKDIEIIANQSQAHLLKGGYLLVEHGYKQQQEVQQIFSDQQYKNIKTLKDLAGQPRVTMGQKAL